MADSFFGFDTSLSNLNDDEGGGEPSEDEYDALNDETFGHGSDEYDWEVEHEHMAEQVESSRRQNMGIDDAANSQLEASLSQLVLDETDSPQFRTFGSSVWRHDAPFPSAPNPAPTLKNVCTVEELERQLRQTQMSQPFGSQSYFQPRFPVILQRPPGLQAPVPLPFAPQQPMSHNINQINQPLNKIIGPNNQMNQMNMQNHLGPNVNQLGQSVNQFLQNANQMGQYQNNQMGQSNMMNMSQNMQHQNHMMQNQMGSMNQMGQSMNQMGPSLGQNVNQMGPNLGQNVNHMGPGLGQNVNQMGPGLGQNVNQMGPGLGQSLNHVGPSLGQNVNQMGPSLGPNLNQMGQNLNQMGQNFNQMGQNMNQVGPNMNQIGQNLNPIGQNLNPIGPNTNQMGQNQMMSNGNQYGPGMNQFPHVMGQSRMMGPPPGMGMPRQNFNSNMGQYNSNFRGPSMPNKPEQSINQQMIHNQQLIQQQMTQSTQNKINQTPQINQSQSPQNKSNQKPITNQKDQKVQKSRIYQNSSQKQNLTTQNLPSQNMTSQNMTSQNMTSQNMTSQNMTSQNMTSQNMTSQNLVQLIQNTHPMLQYNNSYHNANHHPMLNNRPNMFNQSNHPMFQNQRSNGTFNNNRHSINGDDEASSDGDEYAGLMTAREKQWLVNIQMLQLNTGTPYIHDFYYTVFLERQASKEKENVKEAHKANQQNHPFYSGGVKQETHTHRERHNSNRHNSTSEDGGTPRTYVPTQFENSLGKLQCGSVTAPRKIIDVEVVSEPAPARTSRAPSRASTTAPTEVPREMKRTKQLLLDIEALYLILLRIEELNDPLAISNALILKEREEKQKLIEAAQKELENEQEEDTNVFLRNIESVQRRPKQDSPKSESIDKRQVVNLAVNQKPVPVKNLLDEDKDDLVNKMFAGLLHSDRIPQMLNVRKGKVLVSRFLARVPPSHALVRAAWSRVLRAAPAAARRDDGALALLAPHYRKYIQNTTGWTAILETSSLLSEALDPARTPYALTSSLTLSCVCALVEKASLLVNTPEATSNERQWSKFLKTLARALKNTTLHVARPVQPLPEAKLMHHIKQLESRATIEILQRGKTTAEFADLTKNDISEQLIKHLC